MTRDELFEAIVNFQDAADRRKVPNFGKNVHRARQVLRILKSEFHDFDDRESRRSCIGEVRERWEKFWDYPEVKEAMDEYKKRRRVLVEEASSG